MRIRHALGLLAFVLAASVASTQDATTPAATSTAATGEPAKKPLDIAKTNDFRLLFEERDVLIEQLTSTDRRIEELSVALKNLPPVSTLEKSVTTAKRDLQKAQSAHTPDSARIELIEQYLDGAEKDLATLQSSGPLLEDARVKREAAVRRLFTVEQRIASLFDASKDTNRFRTNVTYTFGVLVFIVIAGFYFIAQSRDIAKTIFSGEMGMQFVTLFLIVIAIILFGIMGTLEGKELAALLGGLSGYILGRTSQPRGIDNAGNSGHSSEGSSDGAK